jgi:hypothetical protein
MPEQLETTTQQIKPKRPRKSIKSGMVKETVIAKALLGDSNSKIARDLDIDRSTVKTILSATDFQQHIEEIRSDVVLTGDLWLARNVLHDKLVKGSESAATTMLRGFNVLRANAETTVNVLNNGAMTWIQLSNEKRATTNSGSPIESTLNNPPIDLKP